MKFIEILALSLCLSIGFANQGMAQDLIQIGNRQCAARNSDLHDDLDDRFTAPNCIQFCTVDKSVLPEYRDFPGLVFACSRFDPQFPAFQSGAAETGLSGTSGGLLAGLALLLGLAASGGGSTSGTN